MTMMVERSAIFCARVTARDSFIATGPAYAATLPSADEIYHSARSLIASVQ